MGISKTHLAELLAAQPLADLTAAGQPVFAVSLPNLDVVWINAAALSLFGVASSDELTRALADGTDPVIRQLARTARRSRPRGAPQLQKLLFRQQGRAGTVLTVRCWSAADSESDQASFWVAALDAPETLCMPPEISGPASAEKVLHKSDATQEKGTSSDTAASALPQPLTQNASPGSDPKVGEAPVRRRHVRFMWRSDGDGRVQSIDGALCEVMGCDNSDLIGKTFDQLIEDLPLHPGGPLRAALARRDTWSRIEVLWPFTGSNKCAPVTLGGLPSFGRTGLFDGYSGFGVIHLDDISERPQLVVSRTDTTPEGQDRDKDRDKDRSEDIAGASTSRPLVEDAGAGSEKQEAEPYRPAHAGNVVSLRAWQTGNKTTSEPAIRPMEQSTEEPTSAEPSAGSPAAGETGNSSSTDAPVQGKELDHETRNSRNEEAKASTQDDKSLSADGTPGEKPGLHLNVPKAGSDGSIELSASERNAFREIARALGARTRDRDETADHGASGRDDASEDAAKEEVAKENGVKSQVSASDAETADAEIVGEKTAGAAPVSAEPQLNALQQVQPASMAGVAAAIAATHAAARKTAEAADKEDQARPFITVDDADVGNALVDETQPDKTLSGAMPGDEEPDDEFAGDDVAEDAVAEHAVADNDSDAGLAVEKGPGAEGGSHASDSGATVAAGIVGSAAPDSSVPGEGERAAGPVESDALPLAAVARQQSTRDAAVAELIDRLGFGVLLSQDGEAVYANQPLLDRLGYRDFNSFQGAGGISRMFRGRDPELLAREAAGGAIPIITRAGDVLAMDGKSHNASWNGAPATLLTLQPSQMLEREAKLRGLELDIRKRESEVRELHSILDTATDGVALLDEEGRILSLNGSGQALFGCDQNEVVGEKFTVLLARESRSAAMDYFNGLKSNGVRNVLNDGREVVGRASKGGAIPLFMTIGCISNGPEQRFCAVLRDVTQWKKAERELSESRQEAERTSTLKSEFLAKISHEVRTPLNAILGFAEVIIDERFGPIANERYKDYLKDIHASGTHVLSLINDLLDLSKIEAGKLELDFGSVDVSKVVNECVSIMQSHAIRERVIMRLSLAPRLPNVVADERSLRQIILNILSNAVKYNEPGGQVIVSTALTDAGAAVIRVRDTGIGMSDKDVELALEPFRQIATSRKSGGTGLGLPLTKALVEANRASFTIKSKKDEGTLVEVAFPQTRVLAE